MLYGYNLIGMKRVLQSRKLFFFSFFIFVFYVANAQTGTVGCFTPTQLEQFYQCSASIDIPPLLSHSEWRPTANKKNVPFVYKGVTFDYEMAEWQSGLSFGDVYLRMYSKQNYANVIEIQINAGCFHSIYSAVSKIYNNQFIADEDSTHKYRIFETRGTHAFLFSETLSGLPNYKIMCFNKSELDSIVFSIRLEEQRRQEEYNRKVAVLQEAFARADSLHQEEQTEEAIAVIHQQMGLLSDYDTLIHEKTEYFKTDQIRRKIEQLTEEGEKFYLEERWDDAKTTYTKLLEIDSTHEVALSHVAEINKKLDILEQRKNTVFAYDHLNYASFSDFQNLIEKKVNESISITPNGKIRLHFYIDFDTLGRNNSSLFVSLDTVKKRKAYFVDSTLSVIASSYHSLLNSPPLLSCQIEGLFVNAASEYNLTLDWKSKEVKLIRKESRYKIRPKSGFRGMSEMMKTRIEQDTLYSSIGKYTFLLKEKKVNEISAYDISLEKFSTVGPEAMLYSMLYPGAGTLAATRGKKGSGALVSFTLFGGAGVASYMLYKHFLKKEQQAFNETGEEAGRFPKSDIFKYVAYGTLGVAGVVYITDMFIALAKGCKNLKKSKALRKALKTEPIEIIHEDVLMLQQ